MPNKDVIQTSYTISLIGWRRRRHTRRGRMCSTTQHMHTLRKNQFESLHICYISLREMMRDKAQPYSGISDIRQCKTIIITTYQCLPLMYKQMGAVVMIMTRGWPPKNANERPPIVWPMMAFRISANKERLRDWQQQG